MKVLKSGHKVEDLSEEDNKRMKSFFPIYNRYVRLQPGGWFYPSTFPDVWDKCHEVDVRPSDTYIVAIPKSGITWAIEVAWTLTHNPDINNPDARYSTDVRIPQIEVDYLLHSKFAPKLNEESESIMYLNKRIPDKIDNDFIGLSLLEAVPDPRIIKSHVSVSLFRKEVLETCKIIYMVRDPRDEMVSYYDYTRKWFNNYQGTFDDFIENYFYSELNFHPFWNHILDGYNRRNLPNFLFLYYEDMKANPFKEYTKIAEFLGLKRTPEQIQNVVDYTSFENMKKLTDEGKVGKPCSDGGRFILNDDKNVGFFRKGVSGDWKNKFTEEQKVKVNAWIEKHLVNFSDDFKYKKEFQASEE